MQAWKEVDMKKVAVIPGMVLAFPALGGTAYAAQDSLLGDVSYSAKLGTEGLTMISWGDGSSRAEVLSKGAPNEGATRASSSWPPNHTGTCTAASRVMNTRRHGSMTWRRSNIGSLIS